MRNHRDTKWDTNKLIHTTEELNQILLLNSRSRTSTVHWVRRNRCVAELLLEDGLDGQVLGSAPLSGLHRSQPVLRQQASTARAGVWAIDVYATKRLSKHCCWWWGHSVTWRSHKLFIIVQTRCNTVILWSVQIPSLGKPWTLIKKVPSMTHLAYWHTANNQAIDLAHEYGLGPTITTQMFTFITTSRL